MRISRSVAIFCFFLMATTANAQSTVFPGKNWKVEAPQKHGLDANLLRDAADAAKDIGGRKGFVVVKDGVIVHETYYSGDKDTLYPAFSVAKSFGATLVGIAQTQGYLNVKDKVADWVPVHHPEIVAGATIENLITHTAGSEPPGSVFRYNSGNILNTVPNILQLATGMTPNEFYEKELAAKIGLSIEWPHTDKGWIQIGTQGLHELGPVPVTHRDLARLGLLWLNNGKWKNKQLVDPAFIEAGTTAQFPEATKHYGYLWWLNGETEEGTLRIADAPANIYHALGGSFQLIYVIPDHNMVVVTLGDQQVQDREQTQKLWRVINGFLPH